MGDGAGAARLLDLSKPLVQYVLCLAPDGLAPRLSVSVELVEGRLRERTPDDDDMEASPGTFGKLDRLPLRLLGVRGSVCRQQYPCREGAQAANLRCAP